MQAARRAKARGYLVAVVAVLATALIDASLTRELGAGAPIIALLLPVIIAAVVGGTAPGLLATLLSVALAVMWILPATGWSVAPMDGARAVLFVIEGGLASWLIGSRRRALEAEREAISEQQVSETRYRELVESVNSAILRWRYDGTITYANPYALALFGYRPEELIGRHVRLLLPASDSQGNDLSKLTADIIGQPDRYRQNVNENVSRDGRRIWMLWTNRPLLDANGKILEILAIGSDITKLKETEEALREADVRKNEFLAVLSHELRNPLAPLRTGLELLARHESSLESRSIIEMMQRQIAYLVHLVDDLLDLARISRGKIEMQFEEVDIGRVIDSAIELIRPKIEERGQELTVECLENALPVLGDFHRLTQVIGNMLDNATKYTEPGGHISLSAQPDGGTVVIRVRDDGLGIPAEQLDSVFEMFTQVHEHRTRRRGKDLGIGLAVSRQLVVMHGGSIRAVSAGLGHGTEFVVRLPMHVSESAPLGAREDMRDAGDPRRVLIVDDNVDAAETVRLVLEAKGHLVQTAHSGAAALEALPAFGPEVVVLDIGLPDVDGYEVARRIRELPGGRNVLLIALTGWGQPEDKRLAWESGFDEHLTKPVDASLLTTIIAAEAPFRTSRSPDA